MNHKLSQVEALGEGITVTPDNLGYGTFIARITGVDYSERRQPFLINLNLNQLQQLAEIAELLKAEKATHDLREKQIGYRHTTVDGKCVDCGALEQDYPELEYARTHY